MHYLLGIKIVSISVVHANNFFCMLKGIPILILEEPTTYNRSMSEYFVVVVDGDIHITHMHTPQPLLKRVSTHIIICMRSTYLARLFFIRLADGFRFPFWSLQ
jgi:hypothetical protein